MIADAMRCRSLLAGPVLILVLGLFAAVPAHAAVVENTDGSLTFQQPLTVQERLLQKLLKQLDALNASLMEVETTSVPSVSSSSAPAKKPPSAVSSVSGPAAPASPRISSSSSSRKSAAVSPASAVRPAAAPAPALAVSPVPSQGIYRVTKPLFNLRKDARASSTVLATLREGQEVSLLWFVQGGQWARVRLASGMEGYLNAIGIAAASPAPAASSVVRPAAAVHAAPTPATAPLGDRYGVTKAVNLRMDARATSASLGMLGKGTEVTVLWFVQEGVWARVRLDSGREGYVIATGLQKMQ